MIDQRKVRRDVISSFLAQFFDKIIGYISLVVMIRYLDKGDMGIFFFAASVATFSVLFTDIGLKTYVTREAAQNSEKAILNLSNVLSFRSLTFIIYLFLFNILMAVFKPDIITPTILTSLYVIADEIYFSFVGLFLGLKKISYHLKVTIFSKLFLLGLLIVSVKIELNLNALLFCYLLTNIFRASIAYFITKKHFGRIKINWKNSIIYSLPKYSLPLFLLVLFELIHYKIDTVMIGFMKTYSMVSVYESSYKFLEASRFLIYPIGTIFFPLWSEQATQNKYSNIRKSGKNLLLLAGIIGILISAMIFVISDSFIPLIFGKRYMDAIPILKILFFSLPFIFISSVAIEMAKSIHFEKVIIRVMFISAVINILLNCFLIPNWGAIGAAWATVISQTVLALFAVHVSFFNRKIINENLQKEQRRFNLSSGIT
jgi:O-antigen/teichoic acid export membrane protein